MQRVHAELEAALLVAAKSAASIITVPQANIQNVTEWAKKEACWTILSKQELKYPAGLDAVLVDAADAQSFRRERRIEQAAYDGVEAQRMVMAEGPEYWDQWLNYGRSLNVLSSREEGILKSCTAPGGRIPSEKQCIAALGIVERLHASYQRSQSG